MHFTTPKFSSDAEAIEAFIAFGKIAVNWGPIELILEDILLSLRVRQRLNDVKNFPGAFSSVCSEIRKRMSEEPMFQHLSPKLLAAIAESKALHDTRTVVVHGICQGNNVDGHLMFGKSKRREGWAYKSYNFKLAELEATAERMVSLAGELEPIRAEIRARFLREPDGSLRKL